MDIVNYDDNKHRSEVIRIWKMVFNYQDARNRPESIIDSKLAVRDNLFFVALNREEVVGTILAGYDGHRGWIYSLAVVPEMRKRSIGSGLLHHAEKALKELGCAKINLQILQSNEAVREFYLKNGYRVEERISMGKEIKENIR